MSETRERFLREIAERLPLERLSEVHVFPPLRQGGMESGVAVVAAEPEAVGVEIRPDAGAAEGAATADTEVPLAEVLDATTRLPPQATAGPAAARPHRHTVYTARYRHTLKGPDRGKWEFDLVAEADAPLVTVDAVVRGVQKRTGELAEPERLGPEDLRTALDDTAWRATTA